MYNVPIYGGGLPEINRLFLIPNGGSESSYDWSNPLRWIYVIIQFYLLFLLIFYVLRLTRERVSNVQQGGVRQGLISEGSNYSSELKINNFLSYRKNGITVYQLITGFSLFIFFLAGHVYITRESFEFERQGADRIGGYFFPIFSVSFLVIQTIILRNFGDNISLSSLSRFVNKFFILVLVFAYLSLTFADIEGYVSVGLIATYPALLLMIRKIRRPVAFYIIQDNNAESLAADSAPSIISSDLVPKWVFIGIGFGLFVQTLSLLFFYIEVDDYNRFHSAEDQLPLVNGFTVLYAVLLGLFIFVSYEVSLRKSLGRTQDLFGSLLKIVGVLTMSMFIYDDLFFSLRALGNDFGILYLGSFLVLQLPTSILTGVEISYLVKLKSNRIENK